MFGPVKLLATGGGERLGGFFSVKSGTQKLELVFYYPSYCQRFRFECLKLNFYYTLPPLLLTFPDGMPSWFVTLTPTPFPA
jgi:hypothetical protein